MKKLLLLSFAFILIGAGCAGAGKAPAVVEGDWTLAFDLPNEWVMVRAYSEDQGLDLDADIEKDDAEVFLQTPAETIWKSGRTPDEEDLASLGTVRTEDYAFISATRLASRRIIPSEATDLENGFKQLDPCDETEDCGGPNAPTMKYFLEDGETKYQFNVYLDGHELSEAEDVIFSAQVVTAPVAE